MSTQLYQNVVWERFKSITMRGGGGRLWGIGINMVKWVGFVVERIKRIVIVNRGRIPSTSRAGSNPCNWNLSLRMISPNCIEFLEIHCSTRGYMGLSCLSRSSTSKYTQFKYYQVIIFKPYKTACRTRRRSSRARRLSQKFLWLLISSHGHLPLGASMIIKR